MQTLIETLIAKTNPITKTIISTIPKVINSTGKNKSRYHTVATFLMEKIMCYNHIKKEKYTMRDVSGLSLTPKEFKQLLIELFDGKQFKRKEAIDSICQYWKEQGGTVEEKDYVSVFKRACKMLENEGIYNKGYGVWVLKYKKETVEVFQASVNDNTKTYVIDKEIGNGDSAVYIYYYDSYKELAELRNEVYFACKIGRTDTDPIQRVYSQMGTCFPEKPHIALVINCENSLELETALHAVLKFKHKQMSNSPGKEWFLTNPQEVEEIYYSIQ